MSDIASKIVNDVAELPDRTSPEDQPDMIMVTADELTVIVDRYFQSQSAEIARLKGEVEWKDISGMLAQEPQTGLKGRNPDSASPAREVRHD